MKRLLNLIASLVWGAIFFVFSGLYEAKAQSASQVHISFHASSLFEDTNSGFFDGPSFSASYSHEIADYIHGFIGVGALTANNTTDEVNLGLLNLNTGIDLILVPGDIYRFSIGFGGGLRNRKEVFHTSAIEFDANEYFTTDTYVNTIDYGGLIRMNHSFTVSESFSVGLLSRIQIYNKGDSVFDVGISVGKKF
jgi:hypothetical protein